MCRFSTGSCDVAETCTGTSAVCPTDSAFASIGVSCRGSLPFDSRWCAVAEDCRKDGDLAATCTLDGNCQCSSGFEYKVVDGEVIGRCFKPTESVELAMSFSEGDCESGVTHAVKMAMTNTLEATTGGDVEGITFVCVDDALMVKRPGLVALLKVPKVNVRSSTVISAQLQAAVSQAIRTTAALRALSSAVGTSTPAVASKAVVLPATSGETTLSCSTGVASSRSGLRLPTAGNSVCVTLTCATGYYKVLTGNNDGVLCADATAAGTGNIRNTCVVDSDCTWELGKTTCTNLICVVSTTLAKVQVRTPGSVDKHWCLSNGDCRVNGDQSAYCEKNPGMGNWCQCGVGYKYPEAAVPICVPSTQTPIAVRMSFAVLFSGLSCPLVEAEIASARLLVSNVLGQILVFNNFCEVDGSVTFMGLVNVGTALAQEIGVSDTPQLIVGKLKAELQRGGGVAQRRVGFALQSQYAGLSNAQPLSAMAGSPLQCYLDGATAARYDRTRICQALTCLGTHTILTTNGLTTCSQTTPPPVTVVSRGGDDDDVETAVIVLVSIVVAIVLVAVLLVVYFRTRKSGEKEPPRDDAAESRTSRENPLPARGKGVDNDNEMSAYGDYEWTDVTV